MRPEARVPLGVYDTRADGDELQHVRVPFHPLDGELDADDAVRAHGLGFGPHALHGELAGVVHRLGKHVQLLVFAPRPVLDADMVDAASHA